MNSLDQNQQTEPVAALQKKRLEIYATKLQHILLSAYDNSSQEDKDN